MESNSTSPSYPAVTCLVSCSPGKVREIVFTGRWTLDFFRILLAWSDSECTLRRQCRRSSDNWLIFLREDGPKILRSISRQSGHYFSCAWFGAGQDRSVYSFSKANADKTVATGNLAMITRLFSMPPANLVPSMTVELKMF